MIATPELPDPPPPLPVVTRCLVTRSLPESEGDGHQQKNGDHEARHPAKSGDRCVLATGEHG